MFDFEEDEEQIINDGFTKNLVKLAQGYLKDFFKGKHMHCGGPIHPDRCASLACVDRVLNTSIEDGVPLAYDMLTEGKVKGGPCLVLRVFDECGQLGIPKCFRAGILLVYLEFCYGLTA